MKQQEVFKKIGGIIREINEQYEYLQSADEIFNELELELLAANAHFLSDHIEILRKITSHAEKAQTAAKPQVTAGDKPITPQPVAEDKPVAEPRYFVPEMEEEAEEEEHAIETAPAKEDTHTVEFEIGNRAEPQTELPEPEEEPVAAEPEPTIRHELTLEDIGEDWDEDDEVEDIDLETEPVKAEIIPGIIEPEPILPEPEEKPVVSEPETKPVAEKPEVKPEPVPVAPAAAHTRIMVEEDQVITLNQRMSAQMAASRVSDQLHGQPISDLKSAITLNDKMLYVRELFNGYSLAYSEAIDILNRAKSFEEAEAFLKGSYATKNNWADKQATADKFYALLQRRYAP